MSVNDPKWYEGEVETFQTSGTKPDNVRWYEGEVLSVHEYAAAYDITADAGSYALTGTATGLLRDALIGASSGSIALTGTTLNLLCARKIVPDSGVYVLTGSVVTLTYSGISFTVRSYTLGEDPRIELIC